MSQSSIIAFALLAGFIVYITMKGELPAYAAVVGFGATAATSTTSQNLTATQMYGNAASTGLSSTQMYGNAATPK